MNIQRLALFFLSMISLNSCGQRQKISKEMKEKVHNILGNIHKEVKHHKQAINYQAKYSIGGCNFELLINDFPIEIHYGEGDGMMSASAPINTSILKSGTQTWRIKMYPIHKGGVPVDSIIKPGARAELKIEKIKFKDNGDIADSETVFEFEAPLTRKNEFSHWEFADAGKPYVEYSGTFEAKVPYELTGWSNSVDLTKEDNKALEKELLGEYKKIHNWIQNKEIDNIVEAKLQAEKDYAQALFFNKEKSIKNANVIIDNWGRDNIKMQPMDNYSVKYFGEGRIVLLTSNYDNKSVLWGKYIDKDGDNAYSVFEIYFHRPEKGKNLKIVY